MPPTPRATTDIPPPSNVPKREGPPIKTNRFTAPAEAALRLAQDSSVKLGHGYVGSEHLLLGLLREGSSPAARSLARAGLAEQEVGETITSLVGAGLPGVLPFQGLTPHCCRVIETAAAARAAGLGVNAGHDLSLENIGWFHQCIPDVDEVSIGHALICEALYLGLEETIRRYRQLLA